MDIHLVDDGFLEFPLSAGTKYRHIYVGFGSWPGGGQFGRPGALVGAFPVSGVMHDLRIWGLGQ
jgi:hypothetical protein